MDLKGSLVDTKLRIYPSQKLLNFLKSMPIEKETPEGVLKILGEDSELKTKSKLGIKNKTLVISLTKQDVVYLDKIKNTVEKTEFNDDKPDSEKKEAKENGVSNSVNKMSKEKADLSGDAKVLNGNSENNKDIDTELEKPETYQAKPYLTTSDIDWLYLYLEKRRNTEKNIPYLHELLADVVIEMPKNEVLKRNPVLEARCVKLRAQQEAREYRQMTKGVDNVRMRFPEDSISYQMKQLNRQLIAIVQFLISIFAGFLFGFKGLEWMLGDLDFGFRLLMGVMCALVIALAEIYFLAKKLNEELSVPETVQLGGPPKFADEAINGYTTRNSVKAEKEHLD